MVPVGRLRGLQPFEIQGVLPRGGWGGRQRLNPFPAVSRGKRVVAHFITRGKRVLDHVFREVGHNALHVLGVPASAATASAIPVPTPPFVEELECISSVDHLQKKC